ncbi:protein kinase domain-containing protein [Streptomyces gobiensis]|uniref:protein kinase domain-containing protein n=1 Tax=Streptomyces gobiensis TaxID=2875706 RepID=UPI001E45D551|nr:protein kinase [Streptomyces gobiensis]UGY93618.1 protein kinase [Streptomyces gobiensis]
MTDGMTGLSPADPRQLGPFRLLGMLGGGGTGTVYLGRGTVRRGGRKRTVAVRALRPELIRDRQLRARLRHDLRRVQPSPYLASPLCCELDSERPWIASEFVPGRSLGHLVSRYGPLSEHAVRTLGGAVAQALAALHTAGVAHRDLRPGSTLLTGGPPRVVDCGLGLARMPASGEEPADDIFELGALLVFAASAHQPFTTSLLPAAREDPDLTGVPEGLRPTLLACLHKTPESRPAPGALARFLDLEESAGRPAAEWLPEAWLYEIGTFERAARALSGRRRFGFGSGFRSGFGFGSG